MGKTKQHRKPDIETVRLNYDELEIALVALSIRQEELRESRSPANNTELEILWHVCDKMDYAQRNLESKMTRQVSDWLRSVNKEVNDLTEKKRIAKPGKAPQTAPVENLTSRLSKFFRL